MRNIILKPVKASGKVFRFLEKKSLIKTLKPAKKVTATRKKTGTVDILYTSKKSFGGHRLLAVGKRNIKIQFYYHKDNEDIILLNPLNLKFRPLYLIIALDKIDVFLKKMRDNKLDSKDIMAVELVFNDPALSFFTMLKNTAHCEITKDNNMQHPVFFVSESAGLKNIKVDHKNIKFIINSGDNNAA